MDFEKGIWLCKNIVYFFVIHIFILFKNNIYVLNLKELLQTLSHIVKLVYYLRFFLM